MFGRRKKVKTLISEKINISICRSVLRSIFDECDRYDYDETGGRILGFYVRKDDVLEIQIRGEIGPGPKSRRSPTVFFQDGEFQEKIFRKIEAEHPSIEHLGNWHTHHVNGLNTLSGGDRETYTRTVNHKNHNTDFFYALLVIARNDGSDVDERYAIKHFIIFKNDPTFYEIPHSQVNIVDDQAVWVGESEVNKSDAKLTTHGDASTVSQAKQIRVLDNMFMPEMYPEFKPFLSKETSRVYWKGKLKLINDDFLSVAILEVQDNGQISYSIGLNESDGKLYQSYEPYSDLIFPSAVKAIWSLEKDLNREVFLKGR